MALVKWGPRLWNWYFGVKKELAETHLQLAGSYKEQRDELEKQKGRLQTELRDCKGRVIDMQVDLDTRADISAQDRAYIRGLERLCRDHKVVGYEELRKAIIDRFLANTKLE